MGVKTIQRPHFASCTSPHHLLVAQPHPHPSYRACLSLIYAPASFCKRSMPPPLRYTCHKHRTSLPVCPRTGSTYSRTRQNIQRTDRIIRQRQSSTRHHHPEKDAVIEAALLLTPTEKPVLEDPKSKSTCHVEGDARYDRAPIEITSPLLLVLPLSTQQASYAPSDSDLAYPAPSQ